ncbi:MAG: hypothetical protein A3B38_04165 [Candidatus Levybacteria bacterium RIFCSPLOWO2_01_FULL_36_13]|nr:MAG: hypothetical protein A2684_01090 [Candidatus Levybacteria bacterium RIFCSPHIGHO2_01_FULL_36_15b]OGH34321.1 MAG: hypothetical protein A3B38_04165 [Candidatus Levybacteria bacterium RIFCSPLOWO2_01_FULL_36_13]
MTKEIENLKQMSAQREVFSSLVNKREKQYSMLGQQVNQESLEKAVKIGEIMDRTQARQLRIAEKVELLDQSISTESERVESLIQRLEELGSRNPAIHSVYETFRSEFEDWNTPQTAKPEEIIPQPVVEEISVPAVPEVSAGFEGQTRIGGKKEIYVLPNGTELKTTQTRLRILQALEKGPASMEELEEVTGKNAGWVSSTIHQLDNQLQQYNYRIRNLSSAKQFGARYVRQYEGEEDITQGVQEHSEKDLTEDSHAEQETEASLESGALQIPQIPVLRHIESANPHKYDETITVKYALGQIESIAPNERTEEEQQLVKDAEYLKKYTPSIRYQSIYTQEEIHGLVLKLKTLEGKKREDFDDVEDRIINHLIQIEKSTSSKYESPKKSTSWVTLKNRAFRVSRYLAAKYAQRQEQAGYFINLHDPHPETPPHDLSAIFTFVAYDHAVNTIGARTVGVTDQRFANFESNCEAINKWYEAAKPFIDKIPGHLKLPTGYDEHQRQVGARWFLSDLVATMNIRLNGNGHNKFEGFEKYYRYDVAGAMALQYKIKHTVDEINEMLKNITTEEIVPLEPNS